MSCIDDSTSLSNARSEMSAETFSVNADAAVQTWSAERRKLEETRAIQRILELTPEDERAAVARMLAEPTAVPRAASSKEVAALLSIVVSVRSAEEQARSSTDASAAYGVVADDQMLVTIALVDQLKNGDRAAVIRRTSADEGVPLVILPAVVSQRVIGQAMRAAADSRRAMPNRGKVLVIEISETATALSTERQPHADWMSAVEILRTTPVGDVPGVGPARARTFKLSLPIR